MEPVIYQNQYGRLILEPMEYMPVRDIKPPDESFQFSIETAEQIALITDNRRIQVSPVNGLDLKLGFFVIHHEGCSNGAVCKVVDIEYYLDIPARRVIELVASSKKELNHGYY